MPVSSWDQVCCAVLLSIFHSVFIVGVFSGFVARAAFTFRLYANFVVLLPSWNHRSVPRFRLGQPAVRVEGSPAAVLRPTQFSGFYRASYQEGEGERDPQSKTAHRPEEGEGV